MFAGISLYDEGCSYFDLRESGIISSYNYIIQVLIEMPTKISCPQSKSSIEPMFMQMRNGVEP